MGYKELRKEFVKPSFRENLKKELSNKCVNCGSEEFIEYHHIVPLKNGGTNNLTNIVPLCTMCHYKAHDISAFKNRNGGRPKVISYEESEPILCKYFNLEIGTKEAKKLLNISTTTKSTWYRLTKEYREKHNIDCKFRNTIDVKNSQTKRLETMKTQF